MNSCRSMGTSIILSSCRRLGTNFAMLHLAQRAGWTMDYFPILGHPIGPLGFLEASERFLEASEEFLEAAMDILKLLWIS